LAKTEGGEPETEKELKLRDRESKPWEQSHETTAESAKTTK